VMFYGRGAGQDPTASAVVADVMSVAAGWYPKAFAQMSLWPDQQPPVNLLGPDELHSRFYVRINAMDKPGTLAKLTALLGEAGISLSGVIQHESNQGQFVPVVITTHRARYGALRGALEKISRLDVVESMPVAIRILEMP
jgi:homoserine dehydrogenase